MTVNGNSLRNARKELGLTQVEAAKRMGVSQTYLSMLEKGEREFTEDLSRRSVRLFGLSPAALPLRTEPKKLRPTTNEKLVKDLAALKYPGFLHHKSSEVSNPAEVLLRALKTDDLEVRLAEALPWVLFTFNDLEWQRLVDIAKLNDLQNRLGFINSLALKLAEKTGDKKKQREFRLRDQALEKSLLAKEDTLCRSSMTQVEKRWLRNNRSPEAARWNILSGLSIGDIKYVN